MEGRWGEEEVRREAVVAETNFRRKYMAYCWLTRKEVTGSTPLWGWSSW